MSGRVISKNGWSIVYEKAIRDDGSLYFPERLNKEFLEQVRRTMGSYIFANQYLNEVIPEDDKRFRKEWLRYYRELPERVHRFCFVDPAISTTAGSDFTALVAISVDVDGKWFVEVANRYKKTPTEIINLIFDAHAQFKFDAIGVEDVAYQKALLYMLHEESMRRGVTLPVTGIKPDTQKSKNTRILGLVPRFEWGMVYLKPGLHDLEGELMQFPRAAHDDLVDALAYMDQLAFKPMREVQDHENIGPNHPDYEKYYIRRIAEQKQTDVTDADQAY